MELAEKKSEEYLLPFIIVGGSLIFYAISFYNYPLFHSLIEISTIVVALGISIIVWSSRNYAKNDFLLIIGAAYFFIGILDLLHALTYKGINIIPGIGSDIPTQLWIASRYLLSISFLAAFLYLGKKDQGTIYEKTKAIAVLLTIYSIIFIAVLLSIFFWKIFPAAFIEGSGLTAFKINSEYVISFLFLASLFLLYKKRGFLHEKMVNMLFFSISANIVAELFFTKYAGVFDFSNMLGHLFKFMSFLFLYRAFIDFSLKRPYEFLFLDLKRSEEALRHQASFPMLNPNPVIEIDSSGKISFLNPAAKEVIRELGMDENSNMFFPKSESGLLDKLKRRESILKHLEISVKNRFFGLTLFGIPELGVIRVYAFDITDRKRAEEELKKNQQEIIKKTEEQLVESYRHMGMVNRKISIILEMEEYSKNKNNAGRIADYIIQSAVKLSRADLGIIYEYDRSRFSLIAQHEFNPKKIEALRNFSQKEIKFLEMLVNDCKRISGFCELIDIGPLNIDDALNYFVMLPLTNDSLLNGFIFLGFEGKRSLGSQDLEFLEVFSSHAGMAFSRGKNFNKD